MPEILQEPSLSKSGLHHIEDLTVRAKLLSSFWQQPMPNEAGSFSRMRIRHALPVKKVIVHV